MDELYIKLRRHVYERLDIGRDVADSELYEVIDGRRKNLNSVYITLLKNWIFCRNYLKMTA